MSIIILFSFHFNLKFIIKTTYYLQKNLIKLIMHQVFLLDSFKSCLLLNFIFLKNIYLQFLIIYVIIYPIISFI